MTEQMTVSTDWHDRTWQVHLEGYLDLLRQQPQSTNGSARGFELVRALQYLEDGDTDRSLIRDATSSAGDRALFLLDVCTLRLRALVHEFNVLMRGTVRPRKLDVQKLRMCLKQVVDDVTSLSRIFTAEIIMSCVRDTQPAALILLASWLLLQCIEFLQNGRLSFLETTGCLSTISRAIENIHAKVAALLCGIDAMVTTGAHDSPDNTPLQPFVKHALTVLWPLFATCIVTSIEPTQQEWARQSLLRLGVHTRLPKALHLV